MYVHDHHTQKSRTRAHPDSPQSMSDRIFGTNGNSTSTKDQFSLVKAADWDEATSLIGSTTAVESLKRDDEIACSAPEISPYKPDERVYVPVKINPNRYTINALPFNFSSVTDASQTIAFGPMSFVDDADGVHLDLDSHMNNLSKSRSLESPSWLQSKMKARAIRVI
eukprot:scaffold7863_cov37-Cyclotella_meneghiniana.AAC.2